MQFSLIMVFVDDERTDKVIDASRAAGATGATIVTGARGLGQSRTTSFLGLDLFSIRNVILILVEQRRAEHVLDAVCAAGQLDESLGTGVAVSLDVAKAVGLSEHIKLLESRIPVPDQGSA